MMEVLAEEDDPKDSRTTTEASTEDVEGTTHPRIWGQQLSLRRRDDGPELLATSTEALAEEDEPKDSTTKKDALGEEAEETKRPSERLQRRRQRYIYRPR